MARKAKPTTASLSWDDVPRPPADPLARNDWVHDILARSLYMAIVDPSIKDESTRRREVREIAGTMRGLIPQTRLREAEGVVRGESEVMNHGTGPEMEHAPQLAIGGGRPKAIRGRPRKRPVP